MNQDSQKNPLKWVLTAYFAMGLPFVMLNLVVPIMLTDFEISDTVIAFWTSLIVLPWSLKPIWSPLMEMYRTKKFFIVATQLLSGVSLALLAMSLNLPNFLPYVIGIMALIAFSGATHDIALDGLYIQELNKTQQAQYIGWQGAFYNIAKVMAMGVMVYLAGELEQHIGVTHAWMVIMLACGLILMLIGLYHSKTLPTGASSADQSVGFADTMKNTMMVFKDFFTKKYIWIYIAFIVFYRFTEGLVIKIVPLFLKAPIAEQGMGLLKSEIGLYYGTFGVVAFVIGSILGGYFISWRGLKKSLFTLCCIFNIPFAVYAVLAYFQPESMWFVCSAIVFEYFSYGFGFVGLTLFIMQQVAPGKHQMAHYAFGSSLANLGVMIPGMISGYLSDMLGYQSFFLWALVATVPAFLITWFVPFTHGEDGANVNEEAVSA